MVEERKMSNELSKAVNKILDPETLKNIFGRSVDGLYCMLKGDTDNLLMIWP
jgi:hypothetical protein